MPTGVVMKRSRVVLVVGVGVVVVLAALLVQARRDASRAEQGRRAALVQRDEATTDRDSAVAANLRLVGERADRAAALDDLRTWAVRSDFALREMVQCVDDFGTAVGDLPILATFVSQAVLDQIESSRRACRGAESSALTVGPPPS
jgi:hypothetical protein